MTDKARLRAQMKDRRRALAARRGELAPLMAEHFITSVSLASGACVAGYWPLAAEADPREAMARLSAAGHGVALPVMTPQRGLDFRRWRPGDALQERRYGIFEPGPEAAAADPAVLLVPLLAFDRAGTRLGHGAGFYDRALTGLRARHEVLSVGWAFAGQEVEKLPAEPHDVALDAVVTEAGVTWFRQQGQ